MCLADGGSVEQRSVLNALGASSHLPLKRVSVPIIEFPKGVLVEVPEEGCYLGVEVDDLMLEGEEGSTHWLQGIGLDYCPLLNALWLLLTLQEETDLGGLAHCLIERCDLEDFELVPGIELLLGGCKHCAILESIDEILQILPGFGREEDIGVFGADEDDEF